MSRRFSEEEARRIFARVAERQRATSHADDGLSLADLEEAARAAGLDPALVASAAAELDATPERRRTLASAPVEVVRRRTLPGPLDDDAWTHMVSAARARFEGPGIAGQIGRLREWTATSRTGNNQIVTRLSAEPVGDGVQITLSQSVRQVVFGFSIGAAVNGVMALIFGVMAAFGVDSGLWIPFGILLGISALFVAGTQIGARLWARRREADFDALLDRMELATRADPPARAAEPLAEPPRQPLLDLDALPDTDDVRTDAGRSRDRA